MPNLDAPLAPDMTLIPHRRQRPAPGSGREAVAWLTEAIRSVQTREVSVSLGSGGGVSVAMSPADPGAPSLFTVEVADRLGMPDSSRLLLPYRQASRKIGWGFDEFVLLRPAGDENATPCLEQVRFVLHEAQTVLSLCAWFQLFPRDVREVGEALWRRLVEEGEVPEKEKVTAVEVETGAYAVFGGLHQALDWAQRQRFPRPTVYLRVYDPIFPFIAASRMRDGERVS